MCEINLIPIGEGLLNQSHTYSKVITALNNYIYPMNL